MLWTRRQIRNSKEDPSHDRIQGQNSGPSLETIRRDAVIVVPSTSLSIALHLAKNVTIVKRKKYFSNMCRSRQHSQSNGQRSQSQNSRFSHKDHHELESSQTYDDSKWYSYEQESVCIQFTSKHLYHTKPMNVMFDKINQENMPRVLADLHVSQ